MAITYKMVNERPVRAGVDALVVPMSSLSTGLMGWPTGVADKLKKEWRKRGFKAGWGQVEIIADVKVGRAKLVAAVGLGQDKNEISQAEAVRRGVASAVAEAGRLGLRTVGIDLWNVQAVAGVVAAAMEGIELVSYGFTVHSKKLAKQRRKNNIRQVIWLGRKEHEAEVRRTGQQTRQVLRGVTLARDLVNQPAGHMSPIKLVETAKEIASRSDLITVEVLNRERARREKFTAFLAVAAGSAEEPYVIHLRYRPVRKSGAGKKIWLVGKGITFDSGGLSIKPADAMELMKDDMAGAAAVLGLFAVLEQVAPEVEVHGVITACENMPSGSAYRPGDVLTALNGKTIEVLNTDAEGRITLADALAYAAASQPDAIIDLATLTGACMVALGETVAGLWSNNEALQQQVVRAAGKAGERVETMPMPEEYKVKLESQVADMQNISGSRFGGAISAAMFLREFVGDVPWAHLDIAGPSYMDRRYIPYWDRGATGFGVRLLVRWLEEFGSGRDGRGDGIK